MAHKFFIWQGDWEGGAQRVTLDMANFLAAKGESVTLGVYQKDLDCPLPQLVLPRAKWLPASFQSFFASFVWRRHFAQQFSVVYTHTAGAWKTKHNFLFVHDAADLDAFLTHITSPLARIASWLWHQGYLHLCLKRATLIFAATPAFRTYLTRHGIPPAKIVTSGSFFNDDVFSFVRRPAPQLPIRLIFIGNHQDPRKNFSLLKDTLYDNQNYTLSIYGGQTTGIDRNFHYHGYTTQTQLQQGLSHADIFVLPSASEGFSIALLEALATGIPCVAATTAVPEQLKAVTNIRSFDSADDFMSHLQEVIKKYTHYSTLDPTIAQFSRRQILQGEYETMQAQLASPPTADKTSSLA